MRDTTSLVPARPDIVLIGSDRSLGIAPYIATAQEAEVVRLAVGSYGFLVKAMDAARPGRVTLQALADAIAKVYDSSEPRNLHVIEVLRSVHTRMIQAAAAGLVLKVPSV